MSAHWRISSISGALIAAYFIPTWIMVAFRIMISPIHGLYERPNISVALFISDHLQLAGMATVRMAWLLALGKLTVAAFFAIFLVLLTRAVIRDRGAAAARDRIADAPRHSDRDADRASGEGRAADSAAGE
jgi:hypothetical protein